MGRTSFNAAAKSGGAAKTFALIAGVSLLAAPVWAESHVTGDAAAGEIAFARQCVSCHVVVNDAGETLAGRRAKTGPNLFGAAMRAPGLAPDYRYGPSLVKAGQSEIVWKEENFVNYVQDPSGWLKTALDDPSARSKMTFKVRKIEDAQDIFAFLLSVSPDVATDAAAVETDENVEEAVALKPVSFANDQADRGESKFKKECEECHGKTLKGGLNGGAPIRGLKFEQKYFDGAPASALFELISTAMPPNKPGRFSPSIYADLMAYVLKRNGVQPGAPLPADLEALDQMIITK